MADFNDPVPPHEHPFRAVDRSPLAERWERLEPDEQTLVALALTEMNAGTFANWQSWERFADAAIDLLPALTNGTITAGQLHEIAMRHAFDDHD